MSAPSVFKRQRRIDRQWRGKGSLTDGVWALPKGAVTLSLQTYKVRVLRLLHSPIPTVPDNSVSFLFKCKSTLSEDLLVSHNPPSRALSYFFFFLEDFRVSYADLIVFILQERGEVAVLLWRGAKGGAVCISCIRLAVWLLVQGSRARAGHGAAV